MLPTQAAETALAKAMQEMETVKANNPKSNLVRMGISLDLPSRTSIGGDQKGVDSQQSGTIVSSRAGAPQALRSNAAENLAGLCGRVHTRIPGSHSILGSSPSSARSRDLSRAHRRP